MTKTILITGGAGFIGSHLCDKLIEQGHNIICLDNLFTGFLDNIKHLIEREKFTFIKHDVVEPIDLSFNIDEIYNLACPASPVHYQEDPIKTYMTSVIGAKNVLDLAKKSKATVLQASTSEVYGDPFVHPQTENYWGNVNPIGIRSCYDEGKRGAETLFFDYSRQYNVNIKVVRIFNTYGPRMDPQDGRVVSNFIVQALQGQNLTIYGQGKQTRSFCYVDDLVDGLIKTMASEQSFEGPVNLGNPSEFTIEELAGKVIAKIKGKSDTVYSELPSDDPKQRKPDISLAKTMLKWEPKIMLDEGLEKTISYFSTVVQRKEV